MELEECRKGLLLPHWIWSVPLKLAQLKKPPHVEYLGQNDQTQQEIQNLILSWMPTPPMPGSACTALGPGTSGMARLPGKPPLPRVTC